MNNGADEAQVGQAGQDAIVEQAGASDGPFASMWRALGALKARLYGAAPGLTVQTSECLNSNYFFTWLRVLTTDNVLEDVPDDGWGVAVASDREEDMISVFGSCSMGSEAREATASFLWEEMAPAGERAMRKRGSGSSSHPPVPVLNTNIVARTGSFVVFEHNGMYMRGLALWFALYLPPKGGRCTPLMTEFKNQVVLIAYVYVAAFDQNCLVAVYTSKQKKLDCMPQGHVRDSRQISAWDQYVHNAVVPEVKDANTSLWADAIGRKDQTSYEAHKVATVMKATADLKMFGELTNSLPFENAQEPTEAEGADEGPVHMNVSVNPDKIREFMKHCALDDAEVVHEWTKQALKHVAAFDYQTASLQKYAPVEVAGTEVNTGAGDRAQPPQAKRKAKGGQKDELHEQMTLMDACAYLNKRKKNISADANRMAFVRLVRTLTHYVGSWASFAPTGNDLLTLKVMDLVLASECDNMPASIVTSSSTSPFEQAAKFRLESVDARTTWAWTKTQHKTALDNWQRHIAHDEDDNEDDDEDDSEDDNLTLSKRARRSCSAAPTPPPNRKDKKGPTSEQQLQFDTQFRKLEAGLDKLDRKSDNILGAVKSLPAAAASPGEQDSASDAEKLRVALNAINHLVQEFHQKEAITESPAIRGLINILKNKFEPNEIKAILKKTDINEYLS